MFAGLHGVEDDQAIREYIKKTKPESIEWLISQLRSDPKIFDFTKAGYSFKSEEYGKCFKNGRKMNRNKVES